MAFSLTTRQMRDRSKTVTRRIGWHDLRPGDLVQAIVKGQGLKKGERVEKLGVIEIVANSRERLDRLFKGYTYGPAEMLKEGFSIMLTGDFVDMFCKANGCKPSTVVNRIEFRHV